MSSPDYGYKKAVGCFFLSFDSCWAFFRRD